MADLNVLYLGKAGPDLWIIRQSLLDYFKRPVFLYQTFSPAEFDLLLRGKKIDVILADYVPGDRRSSVTLKAALSMGANVPLICLTGEISDDDAFELIKKGAADCVPKALLRRLPFIVDRELQRQKSAFGRLPAGFGKDAALYEPVPESAEAPVPEAPDIPGDALMEILDGFADGSFIFDSRDNTAGISEKWLRRLGYTEKPKIDLLIYLQNLMHPDDREHAISAQRTAISLCSPRLDFECRFRRSDGQYIWTMVRGKLIYDDNGAAVRYYAALNDITEQKKADAALRESERRALALVDELKKTKEDLTAEVEALRRLHLINSEHMMLNDLNYIYDEILDAAIGITHADKGCVQIYEEQEGGLKIITHRGLGEPFLKYADVVTSGIMTSGAALERRTRVVTPDLEDPQLLTKAEILLARGENIRSAQSTPLISCTGKIYGMLCTHYAGHHVFSERELRMLDLLARQAADFIERKRSELALEISEKHAKALVETLQKLDRNKDEFLNHLSHELRNPLATIIAAISLIEITDDVNLIRETNAIVKNETSQLRRLIDDLLDVTRISSNKVKIQKKYINLSEIIQNSAANFRPQFSQKKIEFKAELDGPAICFHADPARIMQIIENLLVNALTYTDEGGTVELTLREDGQNAYIQVEDNGIGISPEELPMLFNAFYQAEKMPNRIDSGLGLGLSIVKGMAELHNGQVSAYSRGVGYGSTFTVTLPLDAAVEGREPEND